MRWGNDDMGRFQEVMMTKEKFKLRPKETLVIALDDLDLSFTKAEIGAVLDFWGEGVHIADIAEELNRDQDEIAVLIMHLARKGKIQNRKRGVLGN